MSLNNTTTCNTWERHRAAISTNNPVSRSALRFTHEKITAGRAGDGPPSCLILRHAHLDFFRCLALLAIRRLLRYPTLSLCRMLSLVYTLLLPRFHNSLDPAGVHVWRAKDSSCPGARQKATTLASARDYAQVATANKTETC